MLYYDSTIHDARAMAERGEEVWAPFPGSEYLVSNLGRVFNHRLGSFLAQHTARNGYKTAGSHQVHVMVMMAFEGQDERIVDHVDHVRDNNKLCNLQRITRKQNAERALLAGRLKHRSGVLSPLRSDWKDIIRATAAGEMTREEAACKVNRSAAWVYAKLLDVQFQDKEDPPLDAADRLRARSDAAEGRETFWRSWPGHPGLEVSNLGNVRSRGSGRILGQQGKTATNKHRSILGGGQVYVAVMALYGDPKPYAKATIRHYPNPTGDAACNLVWGSATEQGRDSVEQGLTLRGSKHPRALVDETRIQEGFRLFIQEGWSIAQFERHLGVENGSYILSGAAWSHVPRPDGLEEAVARIGRSGEKNHKVTVTDASLAAAFALYVEHRWSGVQFAQHLNIAQPTAHSILSGRTRTNVPRPDGFLYPWPDARSMNARSGEEHHATSLTRESILEVFGRVERGEFKGVKEVGEALGLSRSAAYALVEGRSWADLPRSAEFHAAVSRMQRTVLSAEDQKAAIQALVEGEDRQAVVERYNLSPSKLQAYITKANKLRSASSA